MVYNIKYGATGFVELKNKLAKKYSNYDELFWVNEHAINLYLHSRNISHTVEYKSYETTTKKDPVSGVEKKYFVMDFPRLPRVLENSKIRSDTEIIQILLDLTFGILNLHEERIIHRDIRPPNIMINNGRAYLIDFSHAFQNKTNFVKLNPSITIDQYMAPEQYFYEDDYCVEPYNEAVDLWSLGIILFEMITNIELYETLESIKEKSSEISTVDTMTEFYCDPKFIENMESLYNKHARSFCYKNVYLEWIKLLLNQCPKKRITAKEIHNEIKKHVLHYRINVSIPYRDLVKCNFAVDKIRMTEESHELFIKAFSISVYYKSKCKFIHSFTSISKLIEYFITVNYINNETPVDKLSLIIIAAGIILETCIFDRRLHIKHIHKKTKFSRSLIRAALNDIILHHSTAIFINNTFNFYEDIDEYLKLSGIDVDMFNSLIKLDEKSELLLARLKKDTLI